MPSVFDTNAAFHRSHSSSNIPDLVNVDYKRPTARCDDELPRSASFNCLPALESPAYNPEKALYRIVSTDLPATSTEEKDASKGRDEKKTNRLSKEERPKLERLGRRKSFVARPKSWIQRVKGSPERQASPEPVNTTPSNAPPVPQISKATRDNKTKTVSESFATFARKSWITSSRSPSPSRNRAKEAEHDGQNEGASRMTTSTISSSSPLRSMGPTPALEQPPTVKSSDSPTKLPLQRKTALTKMKQRPQSVLMSFTTLNSANSSTSSLPRSSLDNPSTPRTSTDKVPPVLKMLSTEKLQSFGLDAPRRRDDLWSAFRSLENDFSKFQAKSWSLKTNVVRSALLPFLRNHADHPSNKNLRPEDLDRRTTILNKWWTGLLEVLDGRQNQTVSGVDRPILLDACYAIMTRPEWRLAPSHFAPLSERSPNRPSENHPLPKKKSSGSLNSLASQFMIESVYHNVRNLFIQNLLSQMSFVVDKMSLRHAPASLVTFCGKAAAYAFFFVPGVAEVLVTIWKLQAEVLRRVSNELELTRRINRIDVEEMVAAFPSNVQALAWTSVKAMVSKLRQSPILPVVVSKIHWYGPWAARWSGRDSDLFYVFAKHYHILAEEFMPSELSLAERARAPG
jgi:hypothetical protein